MCLHSKVTKFHREGWTRFHTLLFNNRGISVSHFRYHRRTSCPSFHAVVFRGKWHVRKSEFNPLHFLPNLSGARRELCMYIWADFSSWNLKLLCVPINSCDRSGVTGSITFRTRDIYKVAHITKVSYHIIPLPNFPPLIIRPIKLAPWHHKHCGWKCSFVCIATGTVLFDINKLN